MGPGLRKSNQTDARRWWVYGSEQLADVVLEPYRTFGVAVYHEMEPNASGDMGQVSKDAPSMQLIESPNFYHSDHDRPDVVPASGLEAVARAFAEIVDQVNPLDKARLLRGVAAVILTATVGGRGSVGGLLAIGRSSPVRRQRSVGRRQVRAFPTRSSGRTISRARGIPSK